MHLKVFCKQFMMEIEKNCNVMKSIVIYVRLKKFWKKWICLQFHITQLY